MATCLAAACLATAVNTCLATAVNTRLATVGKAFTGERRFVDYPFDI